MEMVSSTALFPTKNLLKVPWEGIYFSVHMGTQLLFKAYLLN